MSLSVIILNLFFFVRLYVVEEDRITPRLDVVEESVFLITESIISIVFVCGCSSITYGILSLVLCV